MSDILTDAFNYWQARFNVLSEAWRTGDNDAVLKAAHEFVKANDDAPARVHLKTIDELQAEVARLKNRVIDLNNDATRLHTEKMDALDQLAHTQSWKEVFVADVTELLNLNDAIQSQLELDHGWSPTGIVDHAKRVDDRKLLLHSLRAQVTPQPLTCNHPPEAKDNDGECQFC